MNKTQLTRQQKETVGLLSIGTFLEYFDLMLYVHMAVLLNDLFFPKTDDPHVASLYAALAFCSSYVFRPFGGLIIGWIGDKFGRKFTIIITSFTMAASCIVMATVKTYAEIGVTAAVIVTLCRMMQGFSSMGEIAGAFLYCSETFKSPFKYSLSAMIMSFNRFGSLFALIVAFFVVTSNLNWRFVFVIGAIIAIVGLAARTKLKETPEFLKFKQRTKDMERKNKEGLENTNDLPINQDKVDRKTIVSYFVISIPATIWTFITYLYASLILKDKFYFDIEQVIVHNLKVAFFAWLVYSMFSYLVHHFHPLKITKWRIIITFVSLPFMPYYLDNLASPLGLMLFQIFLISLAPGSSGYLDAMCYRYFPIAKRFTIAAFSVGISHSIGHVIASLGLVYLIKCFGNYGLWIYITPILIAYTLAVNYLRKVEIKRGAYDSYPHEDLLESELASNSGNIGNKDR